MLRLDEEVLLAVLGAEDPLALDDDSVRQAEVRLVAVLSDRLLVRDNEGLVLDGKTPARDLLGQGIL